MTSDGSAEYDRAKNTRPDVVTRSVPETAVIDAIHTVALLAVTSTVLFAVIMFMAGITPVPKSAAYLVYCVLGGVLAYVIVEGGHHD
jgi:hypothetical protein